MILRKSVCKMGEAEEKMKDMLWSKKRISEFCTTEAKQLWVIGEVKTNMTVVQMRKLRQSHLTSRCLR